MEFHHIGVATCDIKKSIEVFQKLGFMSDEVIFDKIQQVNICFLRKTGHPDIELIEPTDEKSPVRNMRKSRFLLVVNPVEAIAFNNRKICFCYNKDFGLIELVET
jgi:methylmalonyl-CoA/ethylmalonyl-CoA epimerase